MIRLRTAAEERALDLDAAAIIRRLTEVDPKTIQRLPENHEPVREALNAALRYDIRDFDDQCQWVYLRIATDCEFWRSPAFRYFLDEPLFRPEAKVRNLVTSYRLAVGLAQREA
jgi:hypothetical protein